VRVQANVSTGAESFQIPAAPDLIPDGAWKKVEGGVCAAKGFKATGATQRAMHTACYIHDSRSYGVPTLLLYRSRATSTVMISSSTWAAVLTYTAAAKRACEVLLQQMWHLRSTARC
jgi:hypothetical protein